MGAAGLVGYWAADPSWGNEISAENAELSWFFGRLM
jgi:hypothetical protein